MFLPWDAEHNRNVEDKRLKSPRSLIAAGIDTVEQTSNKAYPVLVIGIKADHDRVSFRGRLRFWKIKTFANQFPKETADGNERGWTSLRRWIQENVAKLLRSRCCSSQKTQTDAEVFPKQGGVGADQDGSPGSAHLKRPPATFCDPLGDK